MLIEVRAENSSSNDFYVVKKDIISTECASIYEYEIFATASDDIDISLSGFHDNEYYTLNNVKNSFTDSINGIIFNNSLTLHFIIENSGNPGQFNSSTVTITNNTTGQTFNEYTDTVTRNNDGEKCVSPNASDYDGLSDTPNSKVGNALKFPRVNAGETAHEYVTVTSDIHYEHDQATPSASWVINHNLGKFPSVTVVDTAGETLWAAVDYTDNNNLTISFNASTSGKAYLN